jgi:DNA-binding response OmpR family regulator
MPAPREVTPRCTVLLAEADASLRRWLGVLLREAGYHVLEAQATPDALRHLRGGAPIHIVITDARLGLTAVREIAQATSTLRPSVPVLQLIGSKAERVASYRRNHVVLWKPFTISELLESIQGLAGPEAVGAVGPTTEVTAGSYTFYLRSPPT